MTANAAKRLIQHYVDNFRALPWRSPPGRPAPDPYTVWLSEIMLQQTTVAAVAPRFERFLARWPTVEALAAARDEDVLSEWAGLGYYARARNLIACAREVAKRGGFPRSSGELSKLPGIGAYTSAAISAIAFGERAAAVDTNVERLIARLKGWKQPRRSEIEKAVLAIMPEVPPGDFVQAMMDLGATICRPKAPQCRRCPLQTECAAYASGDPGRFPEPRTRPVRPLRHGVAWWIEHDHHIWLVRRPAKGMLGGMAALPGTGWSDACPSLSRPIGTVRHVFTHFELELAIERRDGAVGGGWWHPLDRLAEAGLPTLYRRAAEVAISADGNARAAA